MADIDPIVEPQPAEVEVAAELRETGMMTNKGELVVLAETLTATVPANRPRRIYAGMWGRAEIGAAAAGALALLMAVVLYFFWVVPSDRELARNKSEADRLEAELISANSKYGEVTDTETEVARLVSSVDDFETRFLPAASNGQSALYQRLNGLIAAYGLVNTTGPDYSPLETADSGSLQQTEEEKGRAKYRSLYPGVYVSTTLEGSYQSLRRFLREIETGREFIVVSAVELAPTDTEKKKPQTGPGAQPNVVNINPALAGPNASGFSNQPGAGTNPAQTRVAPKGKVHGETVSLRIEMAAYFRRPNFAPQPLAQ